MCAARGRVEADGPHCSLRDVNDAWIYFFDLPITDVPAFHNARSLIVFNDISSGCKFLKYFLPFGLM